jgi:glycosyltransferase involved in cell wall biosynthesis
LRPLRVLQVSEPAFGGVLRHVDGLVSYLLGQGHFIAMAYSSVRTSSRLDPLLERIERQQGRAYDLRVGNAPCLSDLKALGRLLAIIRQEKIEIVHTHSSKAGALGRVAARICGKPCLYTPNAYYGLAPENTRKAWLFNTIERALAHTCWTVNVSPEEADFARKTLRVDARRQVLLPNAVDCSVFRPASFEQKREARRRLGLPQEVKILGSLGRLSYQKDPLTLIESFRLFAARVPDAALCHIGEGELEGQCDRALEGSLADKVFRIPYLQDPLPFYHALDGFVLTSRYEGLPFSALEALACNLPLILSDAPGHQLFRTLQLDRLGYARVEDCEGFAQQFDIWRQNLDAGLTSVHRQVAEDRFSLQRRCERVEQLYLEILASARREP